MRIHLYVRVFRFMSLEMDFKIAFRCEPIATNIAFEGTLPCMGPDMDLQSRVAAKNFATKLTSVPIHGVLFSVFGFSKAQEV